MFPSVFRFTTLRRQSVSGGRKRIRREGLTGERERGLLYLVKSFVIPNYLPSTVDGENPTVGWSVAIPKGGKAHAFRG